MCCCDVVQEHDRDKQYLKDGGGDGEEVDGGDLRDVIRERRPPGLRGRPRATLEVPRDGRRGDLDTQIAHLAVGPRGAPCRIGVPHGADQGAKVRGECRAANAAAARPPSLVEGEAAPVQAHDRVRRDELDGAPPRGPHPGQADPDESIEAVQAQSARGLSWQDGELVAERKDLESLRRPRTDSRPNGGVRKSRSAARQAQLRSARPR